MNPRSKKDLNQTNIKSKKISNIFNLVKKKNEKRFFELLWKQKYQSTSTKMSS